MEIEPATPAGYFNFFVERNDVYDEAFRLAEKEFVRLGLHKPLKPAELTPAPGFK